MRQVIKFGRIAMGVAVMLFATSAMTSCGGDEPSKPAAAGTITGPTEVEEGSTIDLGIGNIKDAKTYRWYRNGTEVQNLSSRILKVSEAGIYTVAGVNDAGEGAASAEHTVTLKGVTIEIPDDAGTIEGDNVVYEGMSIELTIAEIANAETYVWYKDGTEVQNNADRVLIVTDAGTYKVAGANAIGEEGAASPDHVVTVQAVTEVPAAAGAITGPTEVSEGTPITLSIAAIERASTYRWYKDGVEVQDTDSRTLSVTEAGTYKVAGVNTVGEGTASANHVVALVEKNNDPMPGQNQYTYNGEVYNMGGAEYVADLETMGMGVMFLYNEDITNSVDLYLPLDMLDGQTINIPSSSLDWFIEYYGENDGFTTATQSDADDANGGIINLVSATINVTLNRNAKTINVVAHIVYAGDIHLRVNYNGNIIGVPDGGVGPTTPITSIDQLVGTWNATETVLAYASTGWAEYNANHVITITKVDDNTLNVADIMGLRALYGDPALDDDIEVEINENLEMIIPTNVELIPAMEPGTTTHLIPLAPSGTFSDGWDMPFPAQTFGVEDGSGDVVMTMNTGVVVAVVEAGVFGGGYCYTEPGTVWRKSAGGAAAPTVKQAPIGIRKAVATRSANVHNSKISKFASFKGARR